MTPPQHLPADISLTSAGLQIEIPALPEQVSRARHEVASFLHRQSWEKGDADEFLLAVGEACSNAVNYGGRGFAEPRVQITCRALDSRCLQVDVQNQGNGFHPDLAAAGQMSDSDLLCTHGRGISLMLVLVDHVQVLSDGVNTVVRLTKSKTV
jgi:anti-sigma regulatory factor (Ser/Thr protein kinase)